MTNEIKIFIPAEYPESSELFERIKGIDMFGQGGLYRGVPESIEKIEIVKYLDKKKQVIYEGPDQKLPENLLKEYGTLSRKVKGVIYFITPTERNINMIDPVTGVSTSFMYNVYRGGSECCIFDGVPMGNTRANSFWTEEKVKSSGLAKIIKEINPDSKII
ncbi:MAG: hypothetical protein QT10_C0008G0050 [archaeon GW2011_AR19]|nr:MAG: hypothetical protein QT10_C0008G0050 [archaeon GW2011_AR19]